MGKKVIFFIGNLSIGGAERVVSNLSLNLPKYITNEIVLYGDKFKTDYPYNGELIILDRIEHKNLMFKIYASIKRIINMRKLKKENPNVPVISFLDYPNLINILTRRHGKTIISVRNYISKKHKKGLKSLLWKLVIKIGYGKADKIIAVSEEIKRDLVLNYNIQENKISVIYNSYPIENIISMSNGDIENEYLELFSSPVIITSGRLNNQKGQWHLIRAFKSVKQVLPNAKLVILGEGELRESLELLSKQLNLNNDVHFLGFQNNPFKYIARSKLFVLSSLYEGFPNALSEAMACGVPVVSSDCLSGPREILSPQEFKKDKINYEISRDRYGVLVPVCDGQKYDAQDPLTQEEKLLAKSIVHLLEHDELREYFKVQSLKRIYDFDINNIINKWEKIL